MLVVIKEWFVNVIYILSFVIFFYLMLFTGIGRAWIPLDQYERVFFLNSNLFTIVIFLVFLLGMIGVRKLLVRLEATWLFTVLTVIYLALGFYLIRFADEMIRSDALSVFTSAINFNNGDYSSLAKGNYLAQYPHQLGVLTFERLLLEISENTKFFFFINLIFVIGINFFQWRTNKMILNNELAVKYAILLSFLFIPQFFFILFIYGLIPGMLCLVISVYGMTKYFKVGKMRYFAVNLIFITLAGLLKNNFMIAAIAMSFVYILNAIQRKRCKLFCYSLVLLLCVNAASSGIVRYYEHESGITINQAMPKILYLTMGLQDDPEKTTLGGWWNSYHEKTHADADYDPTISAEQGKRDLKERAEYLANHPQYTIRFFHKKVRSTWTEPMFQSVWTGPLEGTGQQVQTRFLQQVYHGKTIYSIMNYVMQVYLFWIYLSVLIVLIMLLRKNSQDNDLESNYIVFTLLFFLGGFTFHFFWETKSQYTYPYVYFLIPYAAMILSSIPSVLKKQMIKS